jgi:hypothetical protein
LTISSVAFGSSLKTRVNQQTNYFIIRSEWDDRCVAYVGGSLVLTPNCKIGEAVWESVKAPVTYLKNYFTGKFLSFQPGVRAPTMGTTNNTNLAKFQFIVVHQRNRRYPGNQAYWGVTYHVIRNMQTGLCLMVDGNIVSQLTCNPGRPEHLSFEQVAYQPTWQKSPERVAEEQKAAAPPAPPAPIHVPAPIAPAPIAPAPIAIPTPAPIAPAPVPVVAPTPAIRRPCRRPQ